jgi:hypothetical protein
MRQLGKGLAEVRRVSAYLQDEVEHAMAIEPDDPKVQDRVAADSAAPGEQVAPTPQHATSGQQSVDPAAHHNSFNE